MHVLHIDPRRVLVASLATMAVALAAGAAIPALAGLGFESAGPPPSAGQETVAPTSPSWLSNPLASPIAGLGTPPAAPQ